jgi:aspartate/methionine/tyrosine aminotransferase
VSDRHPTRGFVPPAYPFDRLAALAAEARLVEGGLVDLSIGTPTDPPPLPVLEALATSGSERGYPPAIGSAALLDAASRYLERRFGVQLPRAQVAACVGTKELVAGMPHWLRLRDPARDTVLYPAIAYPTYEMGAVLAGCRAVPVPEAPAGGIDLAAIDPADAERALCLWVNSPANPTGTLSDLGAAAQWGRSHGVPVLSDECYADLTWDGRPRSILEHGSDGVLAVHSISKRSNCAGLRFGFYAGDGELVSYLAELRRHAGFMVPGPVQAAAAVALSDDEHAAAQRERYRRRLLTLLQALNEAGIAASMPAGSFYLWLRAPGADGSGVDGTVSDAPDGPDWRFAGELARRAGTLVSPGEFYGPGGRGFVRIAAVQQDAAIELVAARLRSGVLGEPESLAVTPQRS